MIIDAIILAGGRSSRLDHVAKSGLVIRRRTLLERTVDAAGQARRIVVVGDVADHELDPAVLATREDPPFGGPAAAIASGVWMLAASEEILSEFTLVLACDMPDIARAVEALTAALPGHRGGGGVIAVDTAGRQQPLAAIYDTARLGAAVAERAKSKPLDGSSVFALISTLCPMSVSVPDGSTDDVDTWEDAARFGIGQPVGRETASPEKERRN